MVARVLCRAAGSSGAYHLTKTRHRALSNLASRGLWLERFRLACRADVAALPGTTDVKTDGQVEVLARRAAARGLPAVPERLAETRRVPLGLVNTVLGWALSSLRTSRSTAHQGLVNCAFNFPVRRSPAPRCCKPAADARPHVAGKPSACTGRLVTRPGRRGSERIGWFQVRLGHYRDAIGSCEQALSLYGRTKDGRGKGRRTRQPRPRSPSPGAARPGHRPLSADGEVLQEISGRPTWLRRSPTWATATTGSAT